MIEPIVKRIVELDVHKMVVVETVLIEEEDGKHRAGDPRTKVGPKVKTDFR